MAKRPYFSPHPSGTLGTLFRFWADSGLVVFEMQTRLDRLVKIGAIEVSPKLRQKWRVRQQMSEFEIETPEGWISAHKWRYRRLQRKPQVVPEPTKLALRWESPQPMPPAQPSQPKPVPAVAAPMTYREQRAVLKAKTAALKAATAKLEDDAFTKLKDRKPKVKSIKACVKVCKTEFGIIPAGAKRVWDRLCGRKPSRPKPRKSTPRRQTGVP